jgi:Flp pilus assembly pilin Flp
MTKRMKLIWKLGIRKDQHGQDAVEYALLAGFMVVAAGALIPDVAIDVSTVVSKVCTTATLAAGT